MSLEKKYFINENESMPFNPSDIDQMIQEPDFTMYNFH